MRLKCIIVDDEPLACELLKSYALQTPFLELTGTYNSAIEALSVVNEQKVDLIFLDINMPQMNGLEFSKTLPASVKVVFTTAYDQYAIEGFKVNAMDYLLKPINYSDFLQAANRGVDWFKTTSVPSSDSLFIKSGYRIEKVEYNDILYIENLKDYVKFHLEGDREISSLMNIQQLAAKLPDPIFMRVHRSFIVNLNKIQTIERNCIIFGKTYIPVSDTYKDEFHRFLDNNLIKF
ncbi:LytTR family DNA-binding domain-containing protein [Bacteroidales bacterium OttesenSCG-928-A17]|nr:LytTR family DNA-binding domain-containing protein [Bacteroidales bacterium OttesenSCG-928-A17]